MQMTGPEKDDKRRRKGKRNNADRRNAPPDLQTIASASEYTGSLPAQLPEEMPTDCPED